MPPNKPAAWETFGSEHVAANDVRAISPDLLDAGSDTFVHHFTKCFDARDEAKALGQSRGGEYFSIVVFGRESWCRISSVDARAAAAVGKMMGAK